MILSVLPVEGVKEADLAEMESYVRDILPLDPRRQASMSVPPTAYDPRRGQYDGTVMLRAGLELCPPDATRLLVVAGQDLFIPMLTFIFGQAQLDGKAAIVSLARLHQEFHGLPPRRELMMDRFRKEVLHELGHTFGLTHCPDATCAMSLSINIENIDRKRDELCHDCTILAADKLTELRRASDANEE